jgi:transposase
LRGGRRHDQGRVRGVVRGVGGGADASGPGQVVVMDDLWAHNSEEVRELIEGRGCEVLFVPSYSPDYNPIQEAFSKIKGLLRKAGARTREVLIEALGEAISAVTAEDAWGFFEHCGYRRVGQLL